MIGSELDSLRERGVFSDLDVELTRSLGALAGESSLPVLLGIALASRAARDGNSCVDLTELSARGLVNSEGERIEDFELPGFSEWIAALEQSELISVAGIDSAAPRPLVLDVRGRLYLTRYYAYEERLAEELRRRAQSLESIDETLLAHGLDRLLPAGSNMLEGQRVAAAVALLRRFCVISGGPGTGKTFTVAKVLALQQEQALSHSGEPCKILLLAPTGKAAQRLGEAIQRNLPALDCADVVRSAIPVVASTLHRALGFQARTPTRFRHDRKTPLAYDVVVVDEASMVDLALMTKLVDAVRPEAKLVLLGDKDQLASVDVGSILGDLYVEAESVGYSSEFGERLRRITGASVEIARDSPAGGLRDCRVHLSHSLRFSDASALGALSRAVQAGQASAALEVLKASKEVELRSFESKKGLSGALGELIRERFGKLGVGSVAEKLDILESFRILCCHRRGPLGVEAINAFVAEELGRSGCVDGTERFYEGRPILVTANDYRLELFNGDVGVVGPVPGADALAAELGQSSRMLAVFFPGSAPETWRSVSPGRLPSHETAFAMSVHKSQGSEFGEVVLILPDKPTQLVTRELIYTAITRARRRVVILGSASVLTHAIEARVERASGLRARLASS